MNRGLICCAFTLVVGQVGFGEHIQAQTDRKGADSESSLEAQFFWSGRARGMKLEFARELSDYFVIQAGGELAREPAADPDEASERSSAAAVSLFWQALETDELFEAGLELGFERQRITEGEQLDTANTRVLGLWAILEPFEKPVTIELEWQRQLQRRRGEQSSQDEVITSLIWANTDRLDLELSVGKAEGERHELSIGLSYKLSDQFSAFVEIGRQDSEDFGNVGIAYGF